MLDGAPGVQHAQSDSEDGIETFLEAALGYYSVLDRRRSVRPGASGVDDYDQVKFDKGTTGEQSPSASRLRTSAAAHIERLRGHVSARYLALRAPLLWTPRRVKLRDKCAFVLGVSHIMISAFWLGHSPSSFYKLYTIKALFLLGLRLVLYRRDKMHYYLLDFCYYANALMILQSWALPESCELQMILFSFAMGPLAWSILLFRNSMIFHSLDKMTSLFLHAFPPLVAWAQRWYPPDANHWKGAIATSTACASKQATVRELILIPWLPYLLWAIVYYIKIFVVSPQKIQDRGYQTLFGYLTRKPKSFFGRLARTLPRWLAPLLFMAWHIFFCAATFIVAYGMWQSYVFNTGFLILMLSVSTWNGGNYYFEVFAQKYVTEQEQHRRHSEETSRPDAEVGRAVVRASSDSVLCAPEGERWEGAVAAELLSQGSLVAAVTKEE